MKKTLILLAMVVALVILPFFVDHGGEFGGSDGEAESQIQVVAMSRGSSRCTNRRVEKLRACCLRSRDPSARR